MHQFRKVCHSFFLEPPCARPHCLIPLGWGMTETCATGLRTWMNDPNSVGTVGPPGPFCEVKLLDVPAMKYLSDDKPFSRGELCIRGDICFSGYYKGIYANTIVPRNYTMLIRSRTQTRKTQRKPSIRRDGSTLVMSLRLTWQAVLRSSTVSRTS